MPFEKLISKIGVPLNDFFYARFWEKVKDFWWVADNWAVGVGAGLPRPYNGYKYPHDISDRF